MKTRSKVLSLVLAGTLVVSAGMFGTLAYLTDTQTVTNTFTVGDVAIKLDEAVVDTDGNAVVPEQRTEDGNAYKIFPGGTYTKDPTVTVKEESEDSYLFVKVENGIADIEIEEGNQEKDTIAEQMAANGWVEVPENDNIYVYTQDGNPGNPAVVSAEESVVVFEEFSISGTVDGTTLAGYEDATITVTAYAIQADGFKGETAQDIWAAVGLN